MPRILLLLPSATYRAADFVAAAGAAGAEVVVASEHRQAMADAMGDRAVVVPLHHPSAAVDAIVGLHGRSPLDAVVAVDDQGVLVGALAAARLGLPHNPEGAVRATRDKASMRAAFAAGGIRQPDFRVAAPGDDVAAVTAELGPPVVVKPVSLSASRGVIRADSPDEAAAVAERVRGILGLAGEPGDAPLLVERFVPGAEVAVEGLLRAGRLEVLAVFDKPDPLDGPYFEETIYVTPSRLPAAAHRAVTDAVAGAVSALGLVEGPVHAEVRVDGDDVWVLEVAARSIGGLCSRALRFGAGLSLEDLVVRHALGLPADGPAEREAAAAGVMMLPIPRSGVLREVVGVDAARAVPGVDGVEITVPIGRAVQALPEGDRYLGFVFARGDEPAAVEQALRRAHDALDVRIT